MDNLIKTCCNKLLENVINGKSREELMNDCVIEKLTHIYDSENKEFDELLNKLDIYIDYKSESQVKACIKKLSRMLTKNRKQLFSVLRRIL